MNKYTKNSFYTSLILGLVFLSLGAFGQLKPIAAQYFQNPYFSNAAFAGAHKGFNLNLAYSLKTENLQGASSLQSFSGDLGAGKSGLGIIFKNDKNGLLSTKTFKFTYAYHVKISDSKALHFGISPSLTQVRFDIDNAQIADPSDPFPTEFNSRKADADVDFGTAFTSNKLTLQISLPNLRKFIGGSNEGAFNEVSYLAASYELGKSDAWTAEPIIAYSKITNAPSRKDLGLKLNFMDKQFSVLSLYHSDKSFSAGASIFLKKQGLAIQGVYNTAQKIYTVQNKGALELSLRTNFGAKR
jgi:type IX secretion system PorP/SprF family membrane protein